MKEIWIIGTAKKGQETLIRRLKHEGYKLRSLCLEASEIQALDPSIFQVAVFIVRPESPSDWIIYKDFKRFFPDCLVLIYMPHHSLQKLTSVLCKFMTRYPQLEDKCNRERIEEAKAEDMLL